jgi:hypothetical protein
LLQVSVRSKGFLEYLGSIKYRTICLQKGNSLTSFLFLSFSFISFSCLIALRIQALD